MPTYAEIMAARTPRGGWTRAQLAQWGVAWPPRKGWKSRLTNGAKPSGKVSRPACMFRRQNTQDRTGVVAKAIHDMPERLRDGKGLVAFFDGACWPNPHGKATCSAIIQRDGVRIATMKSHVGTGLGMTNNVAEFAGVQLILDWLIENNISEPITICGDSLIAVKRMRSRTLPTGLCRELASTCLATARECKGQIMYRWVPRELNTVCDALAEEVMTNNVISSGTQLSDIDREHISYVPGYLMRQANDLPRCTNLYVARVVS